MLDVFTTDHMTGMTIMPQPVLAYMFQSLGEIINVQNPDTLCSTMACSAIDKICTFVLNWILKDKIRKSEGQDDLQSSGSPDLSGRGLVGSSSGSGSNSQRSSVELSHGPPVSSGSRPVSKHRQQQQQQQQETHWLVEYLMSNKDIMSYLFVILFQVISFENRSNYWSLSRPLLGLILLNREFFVDYTNSFIQSQLPDRQEQIQTAVNAVSCYRDFSQLQLQGVHRYLNVDPNARYVPLMVVDGGYRSESFNSEPRPVHPKHHVLPTGMHSNDADECYFSGRR